VFVVVVVDAAFWQSVHYVYIIPRNLQWEWLWSPWS